MRTGAINQSTSGVLNAGNWQLTDDFEIPAASAIEKLIIMGDAFADSSQNARTVTASGITGLATDQWKFSELSKSIYFDGVNDYLYCADSADWNFGSGDFTIDGWFRFGAFPSSGNYMTIVSQYTGIAYWKWSLYNNGGTHQLMMDIQGVGTPARDLATNLSLNTWYHLAVVRSGNNISYYVNGTIVNASVSISGSVPDVAANLQIGTIDAGSSGQWLNAYVNGFRIVKGNATWTSDFTPPVYADYGGARTYHTFRGLDGNTDEEYRLLIRQVGGAASSWSNVFINDDTGTNYGYQYLAGASTSTYGGRNSYGALVGSRSTFAAGEVAIFDYKINAKSGTIRTAICDSAVGITGTTVTEVDKVGLVWNNSADNLTLIQISGGVNLGLGVGTRIFLFKRRLLGADASSGIQTGTLNVQGKVTAGEFQLAKRIALPALDSYTKLMLHGDSVTIDATGKAVTANGGAGVATDQYKFSESKNSVYFDGVDNTLTLADSADWNLGSGDFTIDCWIRPAVTTTQWICSQAGSGAYGAQYFTFESTGLGFVATESSAGNVICQYSAEGLSWTANQWYHVAVVRSGNNLYMFRNGVSLTLTISTTISGKTLEDYGDVLRIGQHKGYLTSYLFNGYMAEFRWTKGLARWTSDFTPPVFSDYGGPRTRLTIDGLDGNTDVLYEVKSRVIGAGGNYNTALTFNSDTTAANYGNQFMRGSSTTVSAARNTAQIFRLTYTDVGNAAMGKALIYAKSGYVRTALIDNIGYVNGTSIYNIDIAGHDWNNTSDNVTYVTIASSGDNGMGAGTVVELWSLRKKV